MCLAHTHAHTHTHACTHARTHAHTLKQTNKQTKNICHDKNDTCGSSGQSYTNRMISITVCWSLCDCVYFQNTEDRNLLSGYIAMFLSEFNQAQDLFLASCNPAAALEVLAFSFLFYPHVGECDHDLSVPPDESHFDHDLSVPLDGVRLGVAL